MRIVTEYQELQPVCIFYDTSSHED